MSLSRGEVGIFYISFSLSGRVGRSLETERKQHTRDQIKVGEKMM